VCIIEICDKIFFLKVATGKLFWILNFNYKYARRIIEMSADFRMKYCNRDSSKSYQHHP